MYKFILLACSILIYVHSSGQTYQKKDSTSIVSFVDKIILKANIDTQNNSFSLNDNSGLDFKLSTNNQLRLTLSLDYEFIGASFGFSPTFLPGNNDNDLKGESSFVDYKFRFFLGNWTQEIQYAQVRGFYVENTADLIPNWEEDVDGYVQFPNLKTTFWGGSTAYVLNPNFSFRNVVYNTEWQRKSAGSFIPTASYNYSRLSATVDSDKLYENLYNFRLAPSYYYTFVFRENWFISPFVSPSIGIQFSNYGEEGTNINENNVYWPIALEGGLQLGYSSERIIFGGIMNFSKTSVEEDSRTTIINDTFFAKLYFGYRFNPPKAVKKVFDSVNEKLGL